MSCCDPAWTDERERELPGEYWQKWILSGIKRVARGDENFVKLAEKDCLSSSTCGSEVSMRSDDRDTSCCWSSVVVVGSP
ncbi:hypothetical protein KCV06_g628, partial [Aureobasidium melanogenum]